MSGTRTDMKPGLNLYEVMYQLRTQFTTMGNKYMIPL